MWFAKKYLVSVQLLQKTLEINTQSMDQLREVLFREVPTIRISDTFERPEMATDLMEHDLAKLNLLRQRGSESFASREARLREFRSEERRVGKECVSTCRSRGSRKHKKKNKK